MKTQFTFGLLLITLLNFGQVDNRIFDSYRSIQSEDSNNLWLSFENQNFLHNNEYFNNLYDGITFIGFNLNPTIKYQPTKNLKLEAGWFFLKFSGRDEYSRSVPWFRCQYIITKNIDLILGNIHGTVQHKLIEPLYSFDKHFTSNPETGLQFIVNSKHFDSDLWLNWEKFILPGDPFKEEFTMAGTGNIKLFDAEKKLQISFPLQWLAAHKGGQHTGSSDPLQTYFNTAVGFKADIHPFSKTRNLIGTENYFSNYFDASSVHIKYYSKGYGILSNLYGKWGKFDISMGYWYSEHFIAPKGEPLFQSISQKYSIWWEPKKQLIMNKIQFNHPIGTGINLCVRFQTYYDLLLENMDFSYSLFLVINRDFFLKKLK